MSESDNVKNIRTQNLQSKDIIIPNDKNWSEKLK